MALLARDRGQHRLKAQLLIYPMLDHRTGTPEAPSDNPASGQFVWTRQTNRFGWEQMRGDNDIAPEEIGYFAPALASDLAQLPDTLLAVGALDLLVDEILLYALRLMRAGVPVETHVYPGAPHGFRSVPGELGQRLASDISGALDRFFARGL